MLFFGFGVVFFVNFFEVRICDMGVDLSSADIAVAEQGLNGTKVCAVHEEVCSERVPKGVGSDVFSDPGKTSIFFDNALD